MADPDEILTVLESLVRAYPRQHLDVDALQTYLDHLSDIPAWLLRQAAEEFIRTSPWFPKISDLRQVCARFAGTDCFLTLPEKRSDLLGTLAYELEEAFYQEGKLDPQEWRKVIHTLRLADRPQRARRLRHHLAYFQALQSGRLRHYQAYFKALNAANLRMLAAAEDGFEGSDWPASDY